MKRIAITESQEKAINEALISRVQLPTHIFSDIERGNIPFDSSYFYNGKLLLDIAVKRFQEVKDAFEDDISSYSNSEVLSLLSKISRKCVEKESEIKDQLERICINSLLELFDIPEDGVKIECDLVPVISSKTQFHITPDTDEDIEYDNVASIKSFDAEAKKRCVIDAIIVGAAMRLSEMALKNCAEKIEEIDDELPHLYEKIMKINDYLLFSQPIEIKDESHKQGGYVKVILGNDLTPTKIEAKAVIAPILLIELIRGCMELWASHGLPDDIESAKKVINNADALINDPWYSRLGPILWDKIYYSIPDFDSKSLPTFIMKLSTVPTEEFEKKMSEVFAGTKEGKQFIQEISKNAKYEDEYSSFEYDIRQKQSERGLIEDGYFTEEELEEATYPSNFNVDEFRRLGTFSARVKYCQERLTKLGAGSSRIVYLIDDNTVLKLAKNSKGIAQNQAEQGDYYLQSIGLFAEVYDYDDNGLWIEMERCRKAKNSDFKSICGYDFKVIQDWIDYCHLSYTRSRYAKMYGGTIASMPIFNSEEFHENYEYSIFSMLQEYLGNYQLESIGDLKRLSTWGVNSKNELVVIDFGLTDDVAEEFYGFKGVGE